MPEQTFMNLASVAQRYGVTERKWLKWVSWQIVPPANSAGLWSLSDLAEWEAREGLSLIVAAQVDENENTRMNSGAEWTALPPTYTN